MTYYTYIITNHKNTIFYTGITNNIEKRIAQHKMGIDRRSFSNKYKLHKLIWFQEFGDVMQAIEAEKRIKKWNRQKKLRLIEELNPEFRDLMC